MQRPWWARCPWWGVRPVGYEPLGLGPDAYRGVNLARKATRLPPIERPPKDPTVPAGDEFHIRQFGPNITITWQRPTPADGTPHIAMIWTRPRNTLSSGPGQNTRYTYGDYYFIEPNIPADITPLIRARHFPRHSVLSLNIAIAQWGSGPSIFGRTELRIETEEEMQQGSGFCNGRLTLQSGAPIPTTAITAADRLFFTPYNGDRLALWDGFHWNSYPLIELQLPLASTLAGKLYDVLCTAVGCNLSLSLSAAWASDTARTDALAFTDGVLTLATDKRKKYLGTVYCDTDGHASDTARAPNPANQFNQVPRPLILDGAGFWTMQAHTFAPANAGNADGAGHSDVQIIIPGVAAALPVRAELLAAVTGAAAWNSSNVAFGLDGAVTPTGQYAPAITIPTITSEAGSCIALPRATINKTLAPGRHTLTWLEAAAAGGGIVTWYGLVTIGFDSQNIQAGISGTIDN